MEVPAWAIEQATRKVAEVARAPDHLTIDTAIPIAAAVAAMGIDHAVLIGWRGSICIECADVVEITVVGDQVVVAKGEETRLLSGSLTELEAVLREMLQG